MVPASIKQGVKNMPDTATPDTVKETAPRPRGRPRPDDVVARDEAVFEYVTSEPISTQDIAEATEIQRSHVYLSLYRLRDTGRVQRVPNESGTGFTRFWVRTSG
jgi:predicted Rossmann fold nucleotide-binding protein DprA/Smf involved in DNA uptake